MKKGIKYFLIVCCLCMLTIACTQTVCALSFGDLDGDGHVYAADARLALRATVNLEKLSAEQKKAADADADNKITASDARRILRLCVELVNKNDSCANGMAGAQLVGFTANDYKVYSKNGLIYIDGLLIANKTYPLTSSYAPGGLQSACSSAFATMQAAAKKSGVTLTIVSGYRSYQHQTNTYNRYVNRDGKAKADTYSARPGHSEHQTGLAMDLNSLYTSFANTKEGKWLAANAHKYGFIIRYPNGKTAQTGYIYEPWHVRYVGTDKAAKIYNSGLCLEEYYGITSVYAN